MRLIQTLAILLALGVAAGSLNAEILVLRDGSQVETAGAFEIKGRRILFHDPAGTLKALRLDEVDLSASERANSAAALQPATSESGSSEVAKLGRPTEKRAPVLVLTDADVSHVENVAPTDIIPTPKRIIMYSTSWCPSCTSARALLGRLGVAYEEHDIEKDIVASRDHQSKGKGCGIPLIDFEGEMVCGYRKDRIRQLALAIKKENAANAKKAEDAAKASAVDG
jgi:glutaredoxin